MDHDTRSPAPTSSTRLTGRGRALVVVAPLLLVAGSLFGIVELYALAVADVALVAGALAWVGLRRWSVVTRRNLSPVRVPPGASVTVGLTLANEAARRSPTLTLSDALDGEVATTLQVAPVDPGRSVTGSWTIVVPGRGRYQVGPLLVDLADPFGLARTRRAGCPASVLHVHPSVEALGSLPVETGDEGAAGAGTLAPASAGDEFFSLRPYREGDDLRRVHWPATARSDELVVRQDQTAQHHRMTVAVDLRAATWEPAALEAGLSAAAAVVVEAGRQGTDVRLVTTSGADTGWIAPGRTEAALDALAAACTHDGSGVALRSLLRSRPGAVVLVGSDALDGPGALGAGSGAGSVTVVRVERAGGHGGAPTSPLLPGTVALAPGQPLGPAWEAVVGARSSAWIHG